MSLRDDYSAGAVIGCFVNSPRIPAAERKEFLRDLRAFYLETDRPTFASAAPDLAGAGDGKLALPYLAYMQLDPGRALRGNQLTGDCVSWGIRSAIDISRAYEIVCGGDLEDYVTRQATAMLYAARGHTGQGANPIRVARASAADGILLEQVYEAGGQTYDFRDYTTYWKIGAKYGAAGLPEELKATTRKNRCKTVAIITSLEELRAALANGYACGCGSDIGVAQTGDPISRLSGSWAHEMAIIGFDDRRTLHPETLYIWDNSWGPWNNVVNWPAEYGPRPEGAFILSATDTWVAVRQEGTTAHSDTDGFPPRPLLDFGFGGVV